MNALIAIAIASFVAAIVLGSERIEAAKQDAKSQVNEHKHCRAIASARAADRLYVCNGAIVLITLETP